MLFYYHFIKYYPTFDSIFSVFMFYSYIISHHITPRYAIFFQTLHPPLSFPSFSILLPTSFFSIRWNNLVLRMARTLTDLQRALAGTHLSLLFFYILVEFFFLHIYFFLYLFLLILPPFFLLWLNFIQLHNLILNFK